MVSPTLTTRRFRANKETAKDWVWTKTERFVGPDCCEAKPLCFVCHAFAFALSAPEWAKMLFTSGGERTAKGKQELKYSRIMQMCKLLCPQLEIRPPFPGIASAHGLVSLCPCVLMCQEILGQSLIPFTSSHLETSYTWTFGAGHQGLSLLWTKHAGRTNHHARVPFLVLNLAGLSARDVGPMFWNTLNVVRPSDD